MGKQSRSLANDLSDMLALFLGLSFNWHQTINWHLELERVLVRRNFVDVILSCAAFLRQPALLVVLVFGLSKVA